MALRRQKSLVLILAREFAEQLATPIFLADAEGKLVFYNEPAERILGRTFAEAGELSAAEWEKTFHTESLDGKRLFLDDLPAGVAFLERRPAHGTFRLTGFDGVARTISVTGIPIVTAGDELEGVVAIFWEHPDPGI